ncbi:hypothetical protein [Enterococcus sp. AZ109]|uniref:hypothetical protein n=1 Tax=Enterococcus sp. AZ109 TaxID=2774634 RepID=UPI003F220D72
MSLQFSPFIKAINIAKEDLTKITLEVKDDSLDGQYEDLRKLSGKKVIVTILPESYSYKQQIDNSTKKPVQEWIVNNDGTVEFKVTEQTQLEIDGEPNSDIREIEKKVDRELIDEFIMKATTLEFPGNINPRDVISRMEDGEDIGEIAATYDMSDTSLLDEVEKARKHFAPYADSWDKVRDKVVFAEPVEDEREESDSDGKEADSDVEETENTDSVTDSADSDTKAVDSEQNDEENADSDASTDDEDGEADDGEVDPY